MRPGSGLLTLVSLVLICPGTWQPRQSPACGTSRTPPIFRCWQGILGSKEFDIRGVFGRALRDPDERVRRTAIYQVGRIIGKRLPYTREAIEEARKWCSSTK